MITLEQVVAKVSHAVQKDIPFSLIRIGDGEGRILMYPDDISRHMLNRHLKFWFGHSKFLKEDLLAMRERLLLAIQSANIIGYSPKPKNEFWKYATDYCSVFTRSRAWIDSTTINAHIDIWRGGLFGGLLTHAKKVCLITCREEVAVPFFNRFDPDGEWEESTLWAIPEESNTSKKEHDHPELFEEMVQRIHTNGEGWLYLVGGGILGKSYCHEAKLAGSVAVDIGSLFDAWAGVKSRSFMVGDMLEWDLVGEVQPDEEA